MSIDVRVKEICKDRGIKLAELADKIGVPASSLSQIMKGNPTLSKLESIATALGVDVTDLFAPKPTNEIICPKCGTKLDVSVKGEPGFL